MKTKMLFASLLLSAGLCAAALGGEPAAPVPGASPEAAAAVKAVPCEEKKPYFHDWVPMRPVKSMIAQLKCIGGALCGNHCCNEGSQPKVGN